MMFVHSIWVATTTAVLSSGAATNPSCGTGDLVLIQRAAKHMMSDATDGTGNMTVTQQAVEYVENRQIVSGHKLGVDLSAQVTRIVKNGVHHSQFPGCAPPCKKIFVIRHLEDALISAYAYHESGRECWLDGQGQPNPGYKGAGCQGVHGGNSYGCQTFIDGKDFCSFLSEKTIEFPERVRKFVDFAYKMWYEGPLATLQESHSPRVCMEDVMLMNDTSVFDKALGIDRARPKALNIPMDKGHMSSTSDKNLVRDAIVRAMASDPGFELYRQRSGAKGFSLGCRSMLHSTSTLSAAKLLERSYDLDQLD